MTGTVLREAVEDDALAIARLSDQLGYPMGTATARERFAALTHGGRDAIFVATTQDGQVVGWVHVFGSQHFVTEPFAEVADSSSMRRVGARGSAGRCWRGPRTGRVSMPTRDCGCARTRCGHGRTSSTGNTGTS